MKQFSDKMRDQRVQVADRVRKHVAAARILPKVVTALLLSRPLFLSLKMSAPCMAHVQLHKPAAPSLCRTLPAVDTVVYTCEVWTTHHVLAHKVSTVTACLSAHLPS